MDFTKEEALRLYGEEVEEKSQNAMKAIRVLMGVMKEGEDNEKLKDAYDVAQKIHHAAVELIVQNNESPSV